jgi:hypothetical protein
LQKFKFLGFFLFIAGTSVMDPELIGQVGSGSETGSDFFGIQILQILPEVGLHSLKVVLQYHDEQGTLYIVSLHCTPDYLLPILGLVLGRGPELDPDLE